MPEYRLTTTITEYGYAPNGEDNAERLLDAFMETHPETGPVVSGNLADGTLVVTFSLDAEDAQEAFRLGGKVFSAGMARSALDPADSDVVRVEVELVPAEELEEDRALQPA